MSKKISIILLVLCMLLTGCSTKQPVENIPTVNGNDIESTIVGGPAITIKPESSEAIEEIKPDPITIDLVAVGDNLIHSMVIKSADKINGNLNYDYMYEHIKKYISEADIKVINQETVLVNDSNSYSGYPTFGSPTAIGDAVRNVGFNVITHATNHSYDKKQTGIMDSINYWKQYENITMLGMHDSQEDYETIKVVNYEGINVAMVNYTYGLNGFVLPEDKQYLVDTLYDENKIKKDLEWAECNSDITIVFVHWGNEYQLKQNSEQERLAQMMADSGADLIVGAHPHVIQPLEVIVSDDGKEVPVYYSLGNFISNQDQVERMLGALAQVSITKDETGTYVDTYDVMPIVTHISNYSEKFIVYALSDYTEDLASAHRLRRVIGSKMSIDYLNEVWNSVFSE